jgi:oxalate decarboxylase
MNDHTSSSQGPVSRRSFLGTAAATLGAAGLLAPHAFAQSESNSSSPFAASSANDPPASHITSLAGRKPYFGDQSGNLTRVDASDMHRMKRLSIRVYCSCREAFVSRTGTQTPTS